MHRRLNSKATNVSMRRLRRAKLGCIQQAQVTCFLSGLTRLKTAIRKQLSNYDSPKNLDASVSQDGKASQKASDMIHPRINRSLPHAPTPNHIRYDHHTNAGPRSPRPHLTSPPLNDELGYILSSKAFRHGLACTCFAHVTITTVAKMSRSYMHCNNHIFWHADLTCTYMPPKSTRSAARQGIKNGLQVPEREVKRVDSRNMRDDLDVKNDEPTAGDKRKKSATPEASNKAVKASATVSKSASPSPTPSSPTSTLKATPVQVLKFLLSDAALDVCRPADEIEDLSERPDILTYSQLLSPFEELLCAVILSRPISHRLGLRTIRTVLNAPYEFRNPVAIKTAGPKKVREALEKAHTQHKDKTAEEITLLAEAVSNNDWHNDLSKLRASTKNAVESEREVLRRGIKGLGKTGLDIFYRRVQWTWKEAFPFVDARTQASLEKLGLPKRAQGIEKMIEVRWNELGFEQSKRGFSAEEKRKRAFVMLLERAVGADLEKKIDEVLEEASKL